MSLNRNDVPSHLKWNLSEIVDGEKGFTVIESEILSKLDFSKFEGKLADENVLLECLRYMDDLEIKLEILGVYAMMYRDVDTRNSDANALNSRVDNLFVKYSSAVSFVTPEITALPEEKLKAIIADERFKDYDYQLEQMLKSKPHVLSRDCENILSLGGQVFGGFQEIFTMINNADLAFPEIEVNGEKIKLSHGMYSVCMDSKDRKVRETAFKAFYKAFRDVLNTITATYAGNVNKDVFLTKARKYNSCLERALENEDVPAEVYKNLLKYVNGALPTLHKYVKDRKETLGYDEMHMYDMYVSLVEDAELKLPYEEAFKLVKKGLAPLGEDYGKLLQKAHDEGWIDVEETEGKRSGAYSVGVYGIEHPYVLLNYQPTTHDVFTIAHELGHSMHSYKSDAAQPKSKADYKIFVAEVASTVNEVLLLKYLLKNSTDVKLKKYLCSYYLEMIRTTIFRQTMFAEFEYIAHDSAEKGIPLTKDYLNEEYLKLNKKYYGDAVVSDDEIAYEWARIPHFYNSFYVYKYATGLISAISIAERIYSEGDKAVEDYFRFLSSGASDGPVELLKLAGVDLTKKDAYEAMVKSFETTLAEFESL
ncbi:oligoendopeptidase F [Acidiphilium sp. CAG:727]|nr:oligoendopeptidase F [Acidiphilium sp. CAG:727]